MSWHVRGTGSGVPGTGVLWRLGRSCEGKGPGQGEERDFWEVLLCWLWDTLSVGQGLQNAADCICGGCCSLAGEVGPSGGILLCKNSPRVREKA